MLVYDSGDPLGRAVAERIAVNAREAGITLRVTGEARGTPATRSDARLVRVRLERLDPREVLADLAASLDLTEALRLPDSATAEETYAAERGLVESFRVVGLFHLPETYGLSPRVKNWAAPRWGGWRLEDVWLDGGKA